MRKRGFFFTLLVFIFFFLVLTSVITFIKTQQMREEATVEKIRIDYLDSLSDAIKVGSESVAYLSGYNAVRVAATYVATNSNRNFLNNSKCLLSSCIFELMFNASIEGKSTYQNFNLRTINFSNSTQMGNGTLKKWIEQLNATAVKTNVRLNISITDVMVYQLDPWNIRISYIIYAYMSDMSKESIARFEIIPINVVIPIEGLEEPNYSMNSSGRVRRYIKKYPGNDYMLASMIAFSQFNSSANWSYAKANKAQNPTCTEIGAMGKGTILLVKNSSQITNSTFFCPTINSFQGFIFQDDYCYFNYTCRYSVLASAYNFTLPIYDFIPNSTSVLISGDKRIWNISKLLEAYPTGYFFEANFAPSYLMRLSGRFTLSLYGIESFVSINQSKSAIDYYYFNRTANPTAYKIKGMPNCENSTICGSVAIAHFWLDNELAEVNSTGNYTHLKLYGLERLAVGYD
jgi:hypothetical protein